ncbi:hypothetical protein GCK32_003402 [Trichostrongylus colubriformis]|uniref:Uncharacterized protein n=1 Tax=Trichostrongylus colubriformis TaxID=6319 RepID=A0AAN8GCI4_TRICO
MVFIFVASSTRLQMYWMLIFVLGHSVAEEDWRQSMKCPTPRPDYRPERPRLAFSPACLEIIPAKNCTIHINTTFIEEDTYKKLEDESGERCKTEKGIINARCVCGLADGYCEMKIAESLIHSGVIERKCEDKINDELSIVMTTMTSSERTAPVGGPATTHTTAMTKSVTVEHVMPTSTSSTGTTTAIREKTTKGLNVTAPLSPEEEYAKEKQDLVDETALLLVVISTIMFVDILVQYYVVNKLRRQGAAVAAPQEPEMPSKKSAKGKQPSKSGSGEKGAAKKKSKKPQHTKTHRGKKGKAKPPKRKKATKKGGKTTTKQEKDDTTSTSTIDKIMDLYEPTSTRDTKPSPPAPAPAPAPAAAPAAGKVPNLGASANELAKQNVVDWYLVHL